MYSISGVFILKTREVFLELFSQGCSKKEFSSLCLIISLLDIHINNTIWLI